MFGFLKELKDAAKEGYDEAKQELEEEEAAQNTDSEETFNQAKQRIQTIPLYEQQIAAIADPFRTAVFMDWFTLFKIDESEVDTHLPVHLYTYGEPSLLSSENTDDLRSSLERDSDANDMKSTLAAAATYSAIITDALSFYADEETEALRCNVSTLLEAEKDPSLEKNLKAVCSSITAHLLTAAVDLTYIEKQTCNESMEDIVTYIGDNFDSWQEFGEAVLDGSDLLKLNKRSSRKALSKYIDALKVKEGSPWKNVPLKA